MGRLWLQGVDPERLGMRDWLDVAYAAQIDMPDGWVNRYEVIQKVNEQLAEPLFQLFVRAGAIKPNRETWGRSPQAIAEQRAMMAAAGGPALRPPPAKETPGS